MPNFTVPRMIAGLSFYRDLHGFYAAKDGRLTVTVDVASNDSPGQWTWHVTELASGITREGKIAVAQAEK